MKKVAVDCRMAPEMIAQLKKYGVQPIPVAPDPHLSAPIASHADMNVLVIGERIFSSQKTFVRSSRGEQPIDRGIDSYHYPNDAMLNAVCIGNDFICRSKSVYPEALRYAEACGMRIVSVNQGYVRCNLLVVDEHKKTVITEDVGMERTLTAHGYTVLLLKTRGVRLEPYDNGFIGGASGVTDREVLFCGNIALHEEFSTIRAFCRRYGKEVVSLGKNPLYDYGSILPLPYKAMLEHGCNG